MCWKQTACSSKALLSKVGCACVYCMCPYVGTSTCVYVCMYWAQESTLLQSEEMIEPVFLMVDYDSMKYTYYNSKYSFLSTGVISGGWGWVSPYLVKTGLWAQCILIPSTKLARVSLCEEYLWSFFCWSIGRWVSVMPGRKWQHIT